MAKRPRLEAREAEERLLAAGFALARSKGSHRIYMKGNRRVVVPFHAGRTLHPKIVKQVLSAIENAD
ncbi:MAG TPA: type II toxin-antitoxin system HicA family toxin [Planctomycetota bacterium]|nr:type II toxin-antitoxin system HicA family toxin [Planctomycetota bacterium]